MGGKERRRKIKDKGSKNIKMKNFACGTHLNLQRGREFSQKGGNLNLNSS